MRPQLPALVYRRSPDQDADPIAHHPVVVVGAGPVGLAAAIDLAQHQVPVVLIDDGDSLATGSRAICFAQRTLDIFDRLGCGEPMAARGVSWNVGKVFFRDQLVYQFDLLPGGGHRRPAFINLQQYYVEAALVERARALPGLDARFGHRLTQIEEEGSGVVLTVETPEGRYAMRTDWLLAADGSRSTVRNLCGLSTSGHTFRDRFLIADVRMRAQFPAERWFWFDPPFHPGQSALLHRQPDDIWRIDFQLGWQADPVAERDPERVGARVRAMLGPDAQFELEWVSIYTFSCLRLERFRHGPIFFLGDAAHGVSPFGARGANGGVQDAENLAWKLAYVHHGWAPPALLDSYDSERIPATDENILQSTRSTDFITPKSPVSRVFRDAVLALAKTYPFARTLVNSGRLSTPHHYRHSPLVTEDADPFPGGLGPGSPCPDAPVFADHQPGWLLSYLGDRFCLLVGADGSEDDLAREACVRAPGLPLRQVVVTTTAAPVAPVAPVGRATGDDRAPPAASPEIERVRLLDAEGLVSERYALEPGTVYLVRPDQIIAARWRRWEPAAFEAALGRALGQSARTALPEVA